ncbi:MAG TPA: TetR/AcrR family transcriptional regulator [Actinomycetota bacterium]
MAKTKQKAQRDRRQEILEAASVVITERGLTETRIQDIAERCGVSPGLILYYYESKDRLLVEALTLANDRFYLEMSRELRKMPSAKDRMNRLLELSVPGLLPEYSLLDEWALWLEIWVRALRDPQMARERESLDRRWIQTLADVIRYGRSTAEFTVQDLEAEDLALQLGAMIDGMAIHVLLNDTIVTPERMYRISLESAQRLLGYSHEDEDGG